MIIFLGACFKVCPYHLFVNHRIGDNKQSTTKFNSSVTKCSHSYTVDRHVQCTSNCTGFANMHVSGDSSLVHKQWSVHKHCKCMSISIILF